MAKDMMPAFELYQPDTVDGAIELLRDAGEAGWALAGGNDSLDWFKDRVKRPERVVDLSGLDELRGVRELADGGIEIGALTTLTEVENHPLIRERFAVLANAAGRVASPQIRNTGTLGGNLCQDTRCWYYRYGVDCYRAGGNSCYADSPQGQNRENCLWRADRFVAVSPSDKAPAQVVLDARMVIRGADEEREVAAEYIFIVPDIDIERMTNLEPVVFLAAVRIPLDWAGAHFYFLKVADRNTWHVALVSIAAGLFSGGGNIERIRLAAGGVECVPRRLGVVEDVVTGQPKSEATATLAGQSATRNATPLNFNHFKIPLLRNLVTRAIRDA
jgi:xanthine dehydrogenase YagS FAD-binding subunit